MRSLLAVLLAIALVAGQSSGQPSDLHGGKQITIDVPATAPAGSLELSQTKRPAYEQDRDVPHGKLAAMAYESKVTGARRVAQIYTPPGDHPAPLPVLYLLAPAGEDETAWVTQGRINVILDNLIADKKVRPLIAVMPSPRAPANADLPTNWIETDLLESLLPQVQKRYPAASAAILGVGAGGQQALSTGLREGSEFAAVIAISPTLEADTPKTLGQLAEKPPTPARLIWLGASRREKDFPALNALHERLTKNKVSHIWKSLDGGATWPLWRAQMPEILTRLAPATPAETQTK